MGLHSSYRSLENLRILIYLDAYEIESDKVSCRAKS